MNNKKVLLGTLGVFIVWSAVDFVVHGMLLNATYEATASLWRPMEEMKMGLMHAVVLVSAFFFTLLFNYGFAGKGAKTALLFGIFYSLAVGIGMGFGTYAYQPIPLTLAVAWFLTTVVECVGGAYVLNWTFNRKTRAT